MGVMPTPETQSCTRKEIRNLKRGQWPINVILRIGASPVMRPLIYSVFIFYLLLVALLLTTLIFGIFRFISKSSTHRIPFFFDMSEMKPSANVTLPYTSLTDSSLFEASIHLSLPESSVNLANSVFTISMELYNDENDVCLKRGISHFVMEYKSPLHRGLRAIMLSVPLVIGIFSEYQDMTLHTLSYRVHDDAPIIPRLAVLRLSSQNVQISAAHLILQIGKPTLTSYILHQHLLSFVFLTLLFWFGLMITMGFSYLVMIRVFHVSRDTLSWVVGPRIQVKRERR